MSSYVDTERVSTFTELYNLPFVSICKHGVLEYSSSAKRDAKRTETVN